MHQLDKTIKDFYVNKSALRSIEKRPGFVSKQSFNFAGYHVKGRDGFGNLKVFNDDTVADGVSIPRHPHANFEILSVILSGRMDHDDDIGNRITLLGNDVKLMSTGSGLFHWGTCYNNTNFLQIWVSPNMVNTAPTVTIQKFAQDNRVNAWQLQVSPNLADNVLTIKQNLYAYRGLFDQDAWVDFELAGNNRIFLMPLTGSVLLNDVLVEQRDSAEFIATNGFAFKVEKKSDIWLMVQSI